MGIISRFTDIMSANINALLEKSEDKNADKLLQKYLMDAKNDLGRVKSETAAMIAEERACERRLSECNEQIAKYEKYAMSAVRAGNDEDARKFLTQKNQLEQNRTGLQAAYDAAKDNSAKMRQMTDKLTSDIQEAQGKLDTLKSRLSIAQAQEKRAKMMTQLGGGMDGFDSLADKVQKRIDKADAMVELNSGTSADRELADLEKKYAGGASNTDVEDELSRLKASMNGASSQGAASGAVDDELARLKASMHEEG